MCVFVSDRISLCCSCFSVWPGFKLNSAASTARGAGPRGTHHHAWFLHFYSIASVTVCVGIMEVTNIQTAIISSEETRIPNTQLQLHVIITL